MSENDFIATGSCLCGGVSYGVRNAFDRHVVNCHCSQCQKTTGHHVAAANALNENFELTSDKTLKWFRSSDDAERGFCSNCGGNLFWRADGDNKISIMAGTIDAPSGLKTVMHIYVDSKSDYYELDDDLPKYPESDL